MILGARALGEFGDDPNRYADAKSRKNYASTSPITRASGKQRVVLARYARNRHLADVCRMWPSPPSQPAPAPAPSTTNDEPMATPTTGPYVPSPTGSSASSTAAYEATPSTTSTSPGTPNQTNSALQLDRFRSWDV
jgi:hypothetical protein